MQQKPVFRDCHEHAAGRWRAGGLHAALRVLTLGAAIGLFSAGAWATDQGDAKPPAVPPPPTLDEARLTMGKWIETQQIISKERKDWQQGKEMLVSRLDVVKKEIAALEEKIKQAETGVDEAKRKRDEQAAENEQLKAVGTQLTGSATALEEQLRKLAKVLPDPVMTKVQPLFQRMPADPAKTKVSVAERFQNVLGILNEVNKSNNEISVGYEVHNLADGKPAEVKSVYIGLAEAYYLSATGEAGTISPTADGWKWTSSNGIARDVLNTLEIIQGKQTAAFVPLPVKVKNQ